MADWTPKPPCDATLPIIKKNKKVVLSSSSLGIIMELSFQQNLAFDIFKEAEKIYNEYGMFSERILEILHSFFGENFLLAAELLEKCKLIEYSVDNMRRIFKIVTSKEQYTIYENVNFCFCESFHSQVLKFRTSLTCKHVLAVKLGTISNLLIKEIVSESQLVDFLNEQINSIDENE